MGNSAGFFYVSSGTIVTVHEVCRAARVCVSRSRARVDKEQIINYCVDQNYNSRRCYLNLAHTLLIKQGTKKNEFSGNWIVITMQLYFFVPSFPPFIFSKWLFTLKIKDLTIVKQLQ